MKSYLCFAILAAAALYPASLAAKYGGSPVEAAQYENPADFRLMGDWEGRWLNATRGAEQGDPRLAAQVLPMTDGIYRVAFFAELYNRAVPYVDAVVPGTKDRVKFKQGGFDVVFSGTSVKGTAMLHGVPTEFELTKVEKASPTLGLEAPEGAIVLFDGSNVDAWQHLDGRPFSWAIVDNALEVKSGFWNSKKNREEGIGGFIGTKQTWASFRMHLEFRYPVELGESGQMRGNSGLFLHPVGEIQILNSYLGNGYWDECGAVYRKAPAKVNAARPPLQWQTYDVVLEYPEVDGEFCYLSVELNGHPIHKRQRLEATAQQVQILLQDHINRIQFRNIWLQPL
ncbi:3-keto-disaccharide hydrolase [Pelagicoccus mobilis]|uniref:DUF1080 domain-containing protein n=1 Tax=Pelagicoccus mobilis TaxID=415221 RepID=A0A934RVJ9_9BACT|nr:DUF1080 domain-containing protein [Pelagicoccus mobilis]MBK1877183.1 DUF1080 domain-containing protein [Pelagicoccus mobilis]